VSQLSNVHSTVTAALQKHAVVQKRRTQCPNAFKIIIPEGLSSLLLCTAMRVC